MRQLKILFSLKMDDESDPIIAELEALLGDTEIRGVIGSILEGNADDEYDLRCKSDFCEPPVTTTPPDRAALVSGPGKEGTNCTIDWRKEAERNRISLVHAQKIIEKLRYTLERHLSGSRSERDAMAIVYSL